MQRDPPSARRISAELLTNAHDAADLSQQERIFEPRDDGDRQWLGPVAQLGGMFSPVSCGGSCAPANLWWQQNGLMYQIQIKLESRSAERDQEKILVETANSMVTARRD